MRYKYVDILVRSLMGSATSNNILLLCMLALKTRLDIEKKCFNDLIQIKNVQIKLKDGVISETCFCEVKLVV